jgi:hypothetical protein
MRGQACNVLLMLVLARAVPLRSESCKIQDHILLSQFLRLPQPGGPGPRIYIPQEQGGLGNPRALGSLSVASYDSQGYGGGILFLLHRGLTHWLVQFVHIVHLQYRPHRRHNVDQFSVLLCVLFLLPRNCRTYSFHCSPSLRLLILSSLQDYRHFFMGTCLWRLAPTILLSSPYKIQSAFLMSWASCCCPPTAHSFGLLVLSGSVVRCHLVQMYYHLISRVTLNPYGPPNEDWSLGDFRLVWVQRYIPSWSPVCSLLSWSDGCKGFLFCHWSAPHVGGHIIGCHVADPRGLLSVQWWVIHWRSTE